MESVFDVIVVGTGPAGGSAGLHCAKNSLNTLLIEEHESIGEPVHCGECLSTYAVQNTGIEPPEEVISEHVKGVRVLFPNNKAAVLNEEGFVLEKHLFEQWLASEAEKNGAKIMLGTRLNELGRKNGYWELDTTKGKLRARILIDASGVASVVSRKLGLNERFESVIGIQYELRDIPRDGYLDFYLWPELAPEGYLWMIPKKDGRANVGLVTTQRNKAKQFLDEFIRRMGWDAKVVVKTFGGLIPSSGPLKKTYSEGLMIIGDAAGFTSPLFEGGTHLGLKSGHIAAVIAKKACAKNDFSESALSEYESAWRKEFPAYTKIVKGKKALYGFSDKELDWIGDNFPESFDEFGALEKVFFGIRVLSAKPDFLARGFVPAMKAFEYSQAHFYGW